jgi:hypothetical protein
MLAPLMGVEPGKIYYVNPSQIEYIAPADNLEETAPDGNPWPSCLVHFVSGTIHAKGTAAMILRSWFGDPANREPESNLVVPAAYVRAKGRIQ